MDQTLALHPLLQVLELIGADDVIRQHDVIKGLLIHEVVEVTVRIGKLDGPALQPDIVNPFSRIIGPVKNRPAPDVLELGAEEGSAFSRLHMLKVHQLVSWPSISSTSPFLKSAVVAMCQLRRS